MMRVKKGNQEFRIDEASLGEYLAQGFDLIDDHGVVIRLGKNEHTADGIAKENKELRRRNRQLEEGIAQRDSTIAELKEEIAALKSAPPENGDDVIKGQQSLLDSEAAPAPPEKEKSGRKGK